MRSSGLLAIALLVGAMAVGTPAPAWAAHRTTQRFCGTMKVLSFRAELHAAGRLRCRRARAVMRTANRLPHDGNVPLGDPPGFECYRGVPAGLKMVGCERVSRVGDFVEAIPAPTGPRRRRRLCAPPDEVLAYGVDAVASRGVPCAVAANTLWLWLQESDSGRGPQRHPTGWRCSRRSPGPGLSGREFDCRRDARRMRFGIGVGGGD